MILAKASSPEIKVQNVTKNRTSRHIMRDHATQAQLKFFTLGTPVVPFVYPTNFMYIYIYIFYVFVAR